MSPGGRRGRSPGARSLSSQEGTRLAGGCSSGHHRSSGASPAGAGSAPRGGPTAGTAYPPYHLPRLSTGHSPPRKVPRARHFFLCRLRKLQSDRSILRAWRGPARPPLGSPRRRKGRRRQRHRPRCPGNSARARHGGGGGGRRAGLDGPGARRGQCGPGLPLSRGRNLREPRGPSRQRGEAGEWGRRRLLPLL